MGLAKNARWQESSFCVNRLKCEGVLFHVSDLSSKNSRGTFRSALATAWREGKEQERGAEVREEEARPGLVCVFPNAGQ